MIANPSQTQEHLASRHRIPLREALPRLRQAHVLLIKLSLPLAQLTHYDLLRLLRKVFLHVSLQSTQQERSQDFVQTTNDKQGLFFAEVHLVLATRVGKWRIEPLIERFDRLEDLGQNKVENGPKLGQIVLQRRSSQDQPKPMKSLLRFFN